MCVRYTYYCHNCRQCFGVPLIPALEQRFSKFWYFVCRSREPENVLVDLLCTDEHCLRRTEEGAQENMGRLFSFAKRCGQLCQAQSCYVKPFFMPCRDCFRKEIRAWHSDRWGYSYPHMRRVEPNAVPLGRPVDGALSEERFHLLVEWLRQLAAAPLARSQGESVELRRSRG
jgi:hypothetical protein